MNDQGRTSIQRTIVGLLASAVLGVGAGTYLVVALRMEGAIAHVAAAAVMLVLAWIGAMLSASGFGPLLEERPPSADGSVKPRHGLRRHEPRLFSSLLALGFSGLLTTLLGKWTYARVLEAQNWSYTDITLLVFGTLFAASGVLCAVDARTAFMRGRRH